MDEINIASSQAVLKMSFSMDTRSKSSSPLVNSLIQNRLFKTAADIDEPLVQFIHTMDLSRMHALSYHFYDIAWQPRSRNSGEATGRFGGFELPHCPPGPLTRFAQNRWEDIGGNTPPPRNVVPANTIIIVPHLVTFSESQWNHFHPRAKSLQLHGASLDPPQLLCPWTRLGIPLHTPRHVPLVWTASW